MKRSFAVIGLIAWAFAASALQPAPSSAQSLINYQGRLTDNQGSPIRTEVSVTFKFYDAETSGSLLGGFSDTDLVTPDANGLYATLIGDDPSNPVPEVVFKGEHVWLNVNINGEDLVPRKRLTAVGEAMTSNMVRGGEVGRTFFTAAVPIKAGDLLLLQDDGKVAPARYAGWDSMVTYDPSGWEGEDVADACCYLTAEKILIAYPEESWDGMAATATVDGENITLSAPTAFASNVGAFGFRLVSLGSSKALIVFREVVTPDEEDHLKAVVVTAEVSGLTFGAAAELSGVNLDSLYPAAPLGSDRALVLYSDRSAPLAVEAVAVAVSGTGASATVAFGASYPLSGSDSNSCYPIALGPDKALIVYNDGSYTNKGTAVVATATGAGAATMLFFGAKTAFWGKSLADPSGVLIGSDKVVISERNLATGSLRAGVVTVSGTSVTVGSPSVYGECAGSPVRRSGVALMSGGKVCFAWENRAVMATVAGTAFTWGGPIRFSRSGHHPVLIALQDNRALVLYRDNFGGDASSTNVGFARILSADDQGNCLPGLEAYVGVAERDAAAGQTCLVTLSGGVTEQFSGLAPGSEYYIRESGLSAVTGGPLAGFALAPNKLQVLRR